MRPIVEIQVVNGFPAEKFRSFRAIYVALKRFFQRGRSCLTDFHRFTARKDTAAPFGPDAQKNCFHFSSTSAHALRQGSHFLYGSSSQQLNNRHLGFLYSGGALFPCVWVRSAWYLHTSSPQKSPPKLHFPYSGMPMLLLRKYVS